MPDTGPAAKLTVLGPDPRRRATVRIAVDGRPYGALPEATLDALALPRGGNIDAAQLESITRGVEQEAALRAGLRCLSLRAYAQAELSRRLRKRGHAGGAVDGAMRQLDAMGLLDDGAFAESYVRSKGERGQGPARLKRDLAAMGVGRSEIDAAIRTQWPDGDTGPDMPLMLARRRASQLGGVSASAKRRRLVAYLARRGFTGHHAVAAVSAALGEDADGQP